MSLDLPAIMRRCEEDEDVQRRNAEWKKRMSILYKLEVEEPEPVFASLMERRDAEFKKRMSILDELEVEEPEPVSESEMERYAKKLYRDIEMKLEKGELSEIDEEDLPPYPEPGWCLGPPSPEIYTYRPIVMHTISLPAPLLPLPPSPPPSPPPSFKSLSLKEEQVLEKKTEINDKDKHGHKNKNRVVSKRKIKRGRNMDKNRK